MRRIITPVVVWRGGGAESRPPSVWGRGRGGACGGNRTRPPRARRRLSAARGRKTRGSRGAARESRDGPETEARLSASNRGGGAIWKDAASPAVRRVGAEVSGPAGSRGRCRSASPSNSRAGYCERLSTEESFGRRGRIASGVSRRALRGGAERGVKERGATQPCAGAARGRLPSSITSASPAILAPPRPEALRPEITPGVLLSVIVDRCCEHRRRSKKLAIQNLDGFQPVAGRLIGVRSGNFSPLDYFFHRGRVRLISPRKRR